MKFWYETGSPPNTISSPRLTLLPSEQMIFQTGSYLDFVHLKDIIGSKNQVMRKCRIDFDSLGFLADH